MTQTAYTLFQTLFPSPLLLPMNEQQLSDEEDQLRQTIATLSPEQRRTYYRLERPQLRDPDTYAALNWLAPAGLHHFYLKRTLRGSLNLLLFLLGLALLPQDIWPGLLIWVLVELTELPQLFRAQLLVHRYNNNIMRSCLRQVILSSATDAKQ